MPRPSRTQAPGAHYHVGAHGNDRREIFGGSEDMQHFLAILGDVVHRFGWRCYAYCLMSNHYHLALTTPEPNLSAGMGRLHQLYVHWFNQRHGRTGHLFGGRYWSDVVDTESRLLSVIRYISENPVRAGLCDRPEDWEWSSAGAVAATIAGPPFLDLREYRRLACGGSPHPPRVALDHEAL